MTSVVGIGASAGGIGALRAFLQAVPEDSGIAFVVIMHLSPDYESQLAQVLQRDARIPVHQVRERTALEPDHVYVIPPDHNLTLTDGHLEATEFREARGRRAPIDHFFRTLAEAYPDGIAVLLSGSGTDGVVGLKAVKEQGGLVLVQSPEEAQYDTMPRAAIATGLVDLVLPAAELATRVVGLRSTVPPWSSPANAPELSESETETLHGILAYLRSRTGQEFWGYKRSTLLRRIARRMQVNQTPDLRSYLRFLRASEAEPPALLKDLLISVTSFFRDPPVFAALEERAIPAVFELARGDEVRVWVPACATGEEAYSIAMLLAEHAATLRGPPAIKVFATDLDDGAIAFAREGLYPDAIAADVGEGRLQRFFTREGIYDRVRKELRDLVMFSRHNLLQDPPFSRLQLVSSRNLLIYLERSLQERVLDQFAYALRPGGVLLLGNSEHVQGHDAFEVLDKQNRIFRRSPAPRHPVERLPGAAPVPAPERSWARPVSGELPGAARALHAQALEEHAPPGLLVGRDHLVVHVSESAGRYLEFPGGNPTANVLRIVRPELRLELRSALFRALDKGEATHSDWIPVQMGGGPHPVQLYVAPIGAADDARFALVLFLESSPRPPGPPAASAGGSARHLRDAEAENATLERRLQEVLESSEARQEELTASNEELQSINEEYKSTLEELETSKEELQSVNEELKTVNDELKGKVEELGHSNDDLRNLMAATQVPTLFLDRQLRIKRFTPALSTIFSMLPVDVGRPLAHITHRLEYPGLTADCEAVLHTLDTLEREVTDASGRVWLARLAPYRTDAEHVQGVVATFTEVTRMRQAQEHLRQSEQRFRALVEASAEIVWSADDTGARTADSPSWRAFTGQGEADARGWGWLQAVAPEDRAHAEASLRAAVAGGQVLTTEFRVRRADGEWRTMAVRAVPVHDRAGAVREWVGMYTDITVRTAAEAELRRARDAAERAATARSQFLSTMSHELRTPLQAVIGMGDLLATEVVGPMREPQKQLLKRMEASAWHLVAIIDQVLEYSRVEGGHERALLAEVDVASVLEDVVRMLETVAEVKKVSIVLRGTGAPVIARTDAGKLRQIAANVIGNAVKFTDHGAIDVELESSGDLLLLRVRDTGPGIPPDQLDAVFEPFVRVDGSTTREKGGTGLGLTVSRRLARLLGGDIQIESTLGHGTTFTVRLPLRA